MRKLKSCEHPIVKSVGLALVLALVLGALPALAEKAIEKFQANAIVQTAGRGTTVEVNIYRWSTDEEREELLQAIKDATKSNRRNRDVATALRGQEKTGYVFLTGQTGYPLRYSREFKTDQGRQIILATDRPVSFEEVYSQSQLGDFDTSVMILNVDEEGNGDGIISVGTEVLWNEKTGKLEVTNVTSQPVKLGNVRKVK